MDIGLNRPAIIPPTIVTTMEFLMMELLKCLWVMENVDRGLLRSATLPLAIADFITVVMMVEVNLDLNRPATLPITIVEFIICFGNGRGGSRSKDISYSSKDVVSCHPKMAPLFIYL